MLSAAAQPSSNQPTSSSRRGFWPRRSGASTQSVEAATNAPVNVPPKRLFAACLPLCLSAPHVQIRRRPQSTESRDSICDFGPSALNSGPRGGGGQEGGKSASKNLGSRILSLPESCSLTANGHDGQGQPTDVRGRRGWANVSKTTTAPLLQRSAAAKSVLRCNDHAPHLDRTLSNDANECRAANYPMPQFG